MKATWFNVSLDGKHLFRTDEYTDGIQIQQIECHLVKRFRLGDGYRIERNSKTNTIYSNEVEN